MAVCIRCGAFKHGALTACVRCQFEPVEKEDQAKSMIVTDHFLPRSELETIADRIKNHLPVVYPREAVEQFVQTIENSPKGGARLGIGCFVVVLALLMIALLVFSVTR